MKLRFLAAAGEEHALRQAGEGAARAGLTECIGSASLMVWIFPGTPAIVGPDASSILVGWLHDRQSGERLTALRGGPNLEAHILQRHWGVYALLAADGPGHLALREPSGSLPIYYASTGTLTLYASDAELLQAVLPEPMSPDLHFIRHWLTFPYLRGARTGAAGVQELLPGTCRRVKAEGPELVTAWSPLTFAGADKAVGDFAAAAALLREEALSTIPRFAPPHEKLVVQLSGGLDSSIVAAALAHAGTSFSAVTFATRAPDGDERHFAREAAARAGAELVELMEDDPPADPFDMIETNPLRPPSNPLLRPLHRALSEEFARSGTGCVLDGAGGDNVFGYLNTASPAVDACRRAGFTAGLRTLHDLAELHGCTFWSAARLALRRARRTSGPLWRRDEAFLAPGAALECPDEHPWLAAPAGLPPGAADHVRTILGIHHFLTDPEPGAPVRLHPLLAQPMLELCLRIPSWLWIRGGRDRAVAREAFRGLVPAAILERRGKGRLESMFMKGYMSALPRLEVFLRDGRLAAGGIIDGDAVSTYLRQPGEPRDASYIRLLEIASAEQWLRSFGR